MIKQEKSPVFQQVAEAHHSNLVFNYRKKMNVYIPSQHFHPTATCCAISQVVVEREVLWTLKISKIYRDIRKTEVRE